MVVEPGAELDLLTSSNHAFVYGRLEVTQATIRNGTIDYYTTVPVPPVELGSTGFIVDSTLLAVNVNLASSDVISFTGNQATGTVTVSKDSPVISGNPLLQYLVVNVDTTPTVQNNTVDCGFSGASGTGITVSSDITLTGNTVQGCQYGVRVNSGGNLTFTRGTVTGNTYGVYVNNGGLASVSYSWIYNNLSYGIYNESATSTVVALYNWWGDFSGPAPVGSGDLVFGLLAYDPWVGSEADVEVAFGSDNYSPTSGDPVNTAIGNFIHEAEDLRISGIGLDFDFTRFYNSLSDANGSLGWGWSHTYEMGIVVDGGGVATITHGDGSVRQFLPDGAGGFMTPPDSFETLIDNGAGAYTLNMKEGTNYIFESGALTSITDQNGNSIVLTYDGLGCLDAITDTMGRTIDFTCDGSGRITQIDDPISRMIVFQYDANGDLVQATDSRTYFEIYTYDVDHNILTVQDKRGAPKITLTYDGTDRVVTSQTDAYGNATLYTYDPTNGVTTITDPDGYYYYQYYDAYYRLTMEVDPLGNFAEYTYDANGNRTSALDKEGNLWTYTYDANGNVVEKTDPLGNRLLAVYNALSLPTQQTDAEGNVTQLTYDAGGSLTQVTDPLWNTTAYTYNPRGQKLTETDARGNRTNYIYVAPGYLDFITNEASGQTDFTYDGVGRVLTESDPLGHTTTFTYDESDNLLSVTNDASETVSYSYDENDNRISVTNPLAETWNYSFDLRDRLFQEMDPLGNITTHTYDKFDRKVAETDPLVRMTEFEYDVVGNLRKVIDPLDGETDYTYDRNGRRTSMTDAEGRITTYEYDDVGRLVRVVDPNLGVTLAGYDARGNLTSVTPPDSGATTYAYDSLGRIASETDPLGNATVFAYDEVGNLATTLDGNGVTTTFTYDVLNRLESKSDSTGGSVTFTYDGAGNRRSMTDAEGATSYVYDTVNRLTQVTGPYGHVVQSGYDAAGRRDQVVYPGGLAVTYEYDLAGRLRFVRDGLGTETELTYDAAGQPLTQTNGNGTTVSRVFDDAGRLTSLLNETSLAAVMSSHAFTLDGVGNRLHVSEEVPLTPTFQSELLTFTHNLGDQLTSDGVRTFTYDGNGNRVGDDDPSLPMSLAYDPMDRLTEVTFGGATERFRYNGDGALVTWEAGGVNTRLVLDVWGTMASILAEADAVGTVQRYYVYGDEKLLYSIDAGTNAQHFYHYDAIGSTVALTDSSETITDEYAYSPYGSNLGEAGSTPNPFRYVGERGVMETGSGLLFMRARFYDPLIKRFLGRDPFPGNVQLSGSFNPYSYALNQPVFLTDPSGEMAIPLALLVSATFAYVVGGSIDIYEQSQDVREGTREKVTLGHAVGAGARAAGCAVAVGGAFALTGLGGGFVSTALGTGFCSIPLQSEAGGSGTANEQGSSGSSLMPQIITDSMTSTPQFVEGKI